MVGIAFLAIALSHLLRPREWGEFFDQLRAKGAPGAFVNGMLSLSFGALIVGFHGTQWNGWAGVVTFIGWAQVFKGTLHLCFPAYSLRSMALVSAERHKKLAVAGALMLPLALGMIYASVG
ncbi:MAG: hypothetical protein ABIT20_10650 [Gemmatimonadaceae bacterium]